MTERRFRDMSLSADDVLNITRDNLRDGSDAGIKRFEKMTARAYKLLPLWRQWAIERERLWFAMLGLGLDIEGDDRDMPRREMRARIEEMANAHVTVHKPHKSAAQNILRELDR